MLRRCKGMVGKTVLKFMKKVAARLPNMVMNSIQAAKGDAVAWMKTCERVVGAVGDTVLVCAERSNNQKIKEELEVAKQKQKQDLEQLETEILIQQQNAFREIKEKIQKQRELLEQEMQKEKLTIKTEKVSLKSTAEMDKEMREYKEQRLSQMQEESKLNIELIQESAISEKEDMVLQLKEKEMISQACQEVRRQLKETIEIFDKQLSQSKAYKTLLTDEEKERNNEIRRMLEWQYLKNIDI